MSLMLKWVQILTFIVLLHILWFGLAIGLDVPKAFLPSPTETYAALLQLLWGREVWLDLSSSWFRVLCAFISSFLVAYPLALVSLFSASSRRLIFLCSEFFRYLPVPVFVPLAILWFGLGDAGKVFIVFLGTFAQMIPMFYDTAQLSMGKFPACKCALKWKPWDLLRNAVIPHSAPQILDDCRLCIGWAYTYVIVAELLGAQHGVGFAIIRAQRYLATDRIFAYIIVIGIVGLAVDRALRLVRKWRYPWFPEV